MCDAPITPGGAHDARASRATAKILFTIACEAFLAGDPTAPARVDEALQHCAKPRRVRARHVLVIRRAGYGAATARYSSGAGAASAEGRATRERRSCAFLRAPARACARGAVRHLYRVGRLTPRPRLIFFAAVLAAFFGEIHS